MKKAKGYFLCRAAVSAAAALLILMTAPPVAAQVTGKARIIDGDTLEIAGRAITLFGIDAPETGQTCTAGGKPWPCGENAAFALAYETAEHWVTCLEVAKTDEGESVAVCRMGPYDIGALMVSKGWALAERRQSLDYVDQEAAAKAARAGIWRGAFVPPWEWRQGKR